MKPRIVTEVPGPNTKALMQRTRLDMQSHYRSLMFDDEASRGCYLVDVDGNCYLDMFANFALGSLGYNHPAHREVVASDAYQRAAANPTSTPFITSTQWVEFLETVERRALPAGMAKAFFVDGGGEGVESALKAAFIVHGERRRAAKGEPRDPLQCPPERLERWMDNAGTDAVIVSFSGAFHGRGLGPMSATHSKPIHKADLPAFPWPQVPFPELRYPEDEHADHNREVESESLRRLDETLERFRGKVAAVLVEPVQSEGGDRHASPAFFAEVAGKARAAGAALIFDEVQTGMGATGSMWCHEQLDLPQGPDLVTFGKKMQLGGFFATADYDLPQFGRMYQTRNGDRARAMLAGATIETIHRDSLLDNVTNTGGYFLGRLRELEREFSPLMAQARGRGFLLAFDMPDVATRNDFLGRCMRRGLLATYTGTRSVRMRPHLVTTREDVDVALGIFESVLSEMR